MFMKLQYALTIIHSHDITTHKLIHLHIHYNYSFVPERKWNFARGGEPVDEAAYIHVHDPTFTWSMEVYSIVHHNDIDKLKAEYCD